MLSKLLVSNYVLIDSLEIGFPEGLVIITGETGAGKSILLGALSLVLGARADAGTVGPRGDTCVVEAEFDVEEDDALRAIAQEYDLDTDGGHLIIRRTVARSGRSRSFVNDQPVQVGALQALSARLVDIHSQHQTRLLTDRAFQLEILDHYAGDAALRDGVRASHARLLALRRERADAAEKLQRMASERDFNQAQLERLEAAKLRDGELEALEAEQRQLANAEEIKTGLGTVGELFAPSDDGRMSLDALLKEAGRSLGRIARYVPAVEPLAQRIDSARLELEDIREEVEDLNASTELSEDRLTQVEDRLSLLYALMKKHGCSDIGGLISLRDTLSSALFEGDSLQDRLKDSTGTLPRKKRPTTASPAGSTKPAKPRLRDSPRPSATPSVPLNWKRPFSRWRLNPPPPARPARTRSCSNSPPRAGNRSISPVAPRAVRYPGSCCPSR